jgi:hypothetical protein
MNARVGDLAGRGPLGPKSPKSKPRSASKTKEEREHLGNVAQLRCLVCGRYGVEVHHLPDPRSDMRVLPLCPPHHRREFGPGAYHYNKTAFHDLHGSAEELLERVRQMLAADEDDILGSWF